MRTYNNRRGLGKGLGCGYKNIAPMDSHVHSLSAKGQKTYSTYLPELVNEQGRLLRQGGNYIYKKGSSKPILFKKSLNAKGTYKIVDRFSVGDKVAYLKRQENGTYTINSGSRYDSGNDSWFSTEATNEKDAKKIFAKYTELYKQTNENKLDWEDFYDKLSEMDISELDISSEKTFYAKRTSLDERLGHIAVTGGLLTGMKLADDVIKGEPIEKIKENKRIMEEGFSALASLTEVSHAVSTQKRFREFAEKHGYDAIESSVNRDDWNKARPFFYNGKNYFPYQEFKQSGYGAYHIGDALDTLKSKGRTPLIVDGNRNMRFVFATADPKVTQ